MTTSEKIVLSEERIQAAPEKAQAMLRRMNGRVVETASLKAMADAIYVTIDAYGNIQETGPTTKRKEATSLQLSFALNPDTLHLLEKRRAISYGAPGVRMFDHAKGSDVVLRLESITRLPKGALALKGSFSATLTQTVGRKPLPKPLLLEGTFVIDRAGVDEAAKKIIEQGVGR